MLSDGGNLCKQWLAVQNKIFNREEALQRHMQLRVRHAALLDIDDYALNSQVLFPHPFPFPPSLSGTDGLALTNLKQQRGDRRADTAVKWM